MVVTMGFQRTMAADIKGRHKRPFRHRRRPGPDNLSRSHRASSFSAGQKHFPVSLETVRSVIPIISSSLERVAAGQHQSPSSAARSKLAILLSRPVQFVSATHLTATADMKLRSRNTVDTAAAPSPKVSVDDALQLADSGLLLQARRIAKISKNWPNRAAGKKSQGLYNSGNYCYRRTVMQSLLHIPIFLNWLDGHPPAKPPATQASAAQAVQPQNSSAKSRTHCKCIDPKGCLACALRRLSHRYWQSAPTSAQPDRQLARIEVDRFDNTVDHIGDQPQRPFPAWEAVDGRQADAPEFIMWMLNRMVAEKSLP